MSKQQHKRDYDVISVASCREEYSFFEDTCAANEPSSFIIVREIVLYSIQQVWFILVANQLPTRIEESRLSDSVVRN
jgi:hypothetical protein